MPSRLKKACRKPACPQTTIHRSGLCEKHQKTDNGWQQWQKRKGNTTQRGYGADWRKIRRRILERDHHLCQEHLKQGVITPGNHVDHIVPKAQGGDNSDANLQTLCATCHYRKTGTERSVKGEGGIKSLQPFGQ